MNTIALPDTISVVNDVVVGTDRYGNDTYGPGTPVNVAALVVPKDAIEEELVRDTRVSRWEVETAPDAPVLGTSSITWEGRDLEVVGEPLHDSVEGLRRLTFTAREIKG